MESGSAEFFSLLYEIPPVEHVSPKSIDDAVYWLAFYGNNAKIIAGGTDLLGLLKDGVQGSKMPIPQVLVDIKKIPRISDIEYDRIYGLRIGACATLASIESSAVVRKRFPILAQAAREVATNQIRNIGTIGGNLCQRPWCWYFRSPEFDCYKKGGKQCFAITGANKYYFSILKLGVCVMAHPSDLAPALMALGASVEIVGRNGQRTVPIEDLFNGPKEIFETILENDEIITRILVPKQPSDSRGLFLKHRIRKSWDFALVSVAVQSRIESGVCKDIRFVLGGVAPFPYRVPKVEELLVGSKIDLETIREAAKVALEGTHPLSMNRYKIQLTKALVTRALCGSFGIKQTNRLKL